MRINCGSEFGLGPSLGTTLPYGKTHWVTWQTGIFPNQQGGQEFMRFSIQHNRAIAGNDITVGIEADGNEVIAHVTTNLDGFDIGDDDIDPPSVSYEQQFLQAGDASPHMQHELIVTVTDTQGNTKTADRRWEDAN
jgi:hypothetical protein